jgi:plasmid stabilization system protein ParE
MKYKIIYNPEVKSDIDSAYHWYNKQQPGLGKRFLSHLKNHLRLLENSPESYSPRYDNIRCLPLKKFPFMIHYQVDEPNKLVKVEAVFHTSRDPEKWYKRTK